MNPTSVDAWVVEDEGQFFIEWHDDCGTPYFSEPFTAAAEAEAALEQSAE